MRAFGESLFGENCKLASEICPSLPCGKRLAPQKLSEIWVLTAVVNFMIQLGLLACKQRFATSSLTIKFSYTLHIVTLKFDKSNFSLLALSVLQQCRTQPKRKT